MERKTAQELSAFFEDERDWIKRAEVVHGDCVRIRLLSGRFIDFEHEPTDGWRVKEVYPMWDEVRASSAAEVVLCPESPTSS